MEQSPQQMVAMRKADSDTKSVAPRLNVHKKQVAKDRNKSKGKKRRTAQLVDATSTAITKAMHDTIEYMQDHQDEVLHLNMFIRQGFHLVKRKRIIGAKTPKAFVKQALLLIDSRFSNVWGRLRISPTGDRHYLNRIACFVMDLNSALKVPSTVPVRTMLSWVKKYKVTDEVRECANKVIEWLMSHPEATTEPPLDLWGPWKLLTKDGKESGAAEADERMHFLLHKYAGVKVGDTI